MKKDSKVIGNISNNPNNSKSILSNNTYDSLGENF